MKRYTDTEKEQVRELIEGGMQGVEIAEQTGIAIGTIYEWRKKYGWANFTTRGRGLKKSRFQLPTGSKYEEWKQRLQNCIDEGLSRTEACQIHGLNYSVLSKLISAFELDWPRQYTRRIIECNTCKHREGCDSREPCHYEVEITIEGRPESMLYSRNGGKEAIKARYPEW